MANSPRSPNERNPRLNLSREIPILLNNFQFPHLFQTQHNAIIDLDQTRINPRTMFPNLLLGFIFIPRTGLQNVFSFFLSDL